MVGQSFEVAVLALIEAPSTADVTALMCSGDPLAGVCASAAEHEMARPNPIASASRTGRCRLKEVSGKKRQAESTRDERVIPVPPNDLYRICRDGMPVRMTASIKGGSRKAK